MKRFFVRFTNWLLTSAELRQIVVDVIDAMNDQPEARTGDQKFIIARREVIKRLPNTARWLAGYAIEAVIASRRVR